MTTGPKTPSLAFVVHQPIQQFAPAFRAVHRSARLRTTVIYRTVNRSGFYDRDFARRISWDVDLLGGYDWWAPSETAPHVVALLGVIRRLQTIDPDVVVLFGWSQALTAVCFLWGLCTNRRVMLYGDSTPQHSTRGRRGALRRAALSTLFALSDGAITTGTFNRDFYRRYGMSADRLHAGICPADTELYSAVSARNPSDDNADMSFVIGYAGKLVPSKGVHELLAALALLPPGLRWRAVIVGDGPEKAKLERFSAMLDLDQLVSFLGFRNQSEMPATLRACSVVVVPSVRDFRVLVVIEAMAAGAAVVVSSNTAVWGPGDIVEHGVSGMVYRSGDPADLAVALSRLMQDHTLLDDLRREGARRAADHGPDTFRRRAEDAVAAALGQPRASVWLKLARLHSKA